jgi:hypothetical protein
VAQPPQQPPQQQTEDADRSVWIEGGDGTCGSADSSTTCTPRTWSTGGAVAGSAVTWAAVAAQAATVGVTDCFEVCGDESDELDDMLQLLGV